MAFNMNQKNLLSPKNGFISAATMILMLASLGIVVSILYRSTQGQHIAGKFKQSNQAYQNGDQSLEEALHVLHQIDKATSAVVIGSGSDVDASLRIPENISARSFCGAARVCWDGSDPIVKIDPNDSAARLSDVAKISVEGGVESVTRAVRTSTVPRIASPSGLDMSPVSDPPGSLTITWPVFSGSDVDKIEIRRASDADSQTKLSNGVSEFESCSKVEPTDPPCDKKFATTSDAELRNPERNWIKIGEVDAACTETLCSFTDVDASKFNPGTVLAYAIKATNKDPLHLDSLYSNIRMVKLTATPPPPPTP